MTHRPKSLLAAGLAATILVMGCESMLSVRQARGEPGDDLGPIRSAATRTDVESRLGPAVRSWTTDLGVEYRLYRYDGGTPPDRGAWLLLPIDVLTLGLPSLLDKTMPDDPLEREARTRTLAVAFDRAGSVLGVFVDVGDFTALPADGRPPPATEKNPPRVGEAAPSKR
jgi:hypothetical protein